MSNNVTILDLIAANQAQKEVTANAMFDSMSPAALYGRRSKTTAGLTWGYFGGTVMANNAPVQLANGTVALTASATNFIQADPATGAVSVTTAGFAAGKMPLYEVLTGTATVTSYKDLRVFGYTGAVTPTTNPYDVGGGHGSKPTADEILMRYPFPRAVNFPAAFSGSRGAAEVAATASTVFSIRKNGAEIGTMTFAAAATTATFALAANSAFAAGDVMTVLSPTTPDTTLSGIGFSLAGTR